MRALLKSYGLSDNEIKLYIETTRSFPLTLNEIRKILSKQSEEDLQQIIDNLIEKKLLLQVKPEYSGDLLHFVSIPPVAAILNGITEISKVKDDLTPKETKQQAQLEKFQDSLFEDLEKISQNLIEAISRQDNMSQTTEILSEIEQNVKKFAQVIITDIIKLVKPLKLQSGIDARDINNLMTAINQKITDSEEMASNMFSQFNDIVKDLETSENPQQVEAFKTFIRSLGESIDKRSREISLEPVGQNSFSPQQFESVEQSLYNILTDYISNDKFLFEKLWHVNSHEKIKEIISILIAKSTENLTIIVPNIPDFIPIENLNFDYSEDQIIEQKLQVKGSTKSKSQKSGQKKPSITKKQKREFEESFDAMSKKVSELKGFELSHKVAELLSTVSEINPESVVIESIQGWLNRLLVIRKHLDSNTQYLLLESIEKWKKEYLKKVERVEEAEESPDAQLEKPEIEKLMKKKGGQNGLQIKLISSEPHDNKHVQAIKKKANYEYFKLFKNNTIAILGDDSYLVFGNYLKTDQKPFFEISGFYSTFKPLIESFIPIISRISKEARPSKEDQINKGFNDIIENINDYPGRKIGKKLKKLLDVAFEKDGISLNILELKLLIGKIEKIYSPLPDEMKEYVTEELNRLNAELSLIELMSPPDFRPPIVEEENQEESDEEVIPEDIKIEPIDQDKINNLFEIFLEKIGELQGEQIVEQIDKFIEVILELQGYSQIINWKKDLKENKEILHETSIEKLKNDFLRWKWGILNQSPASNAPGRDQTSDDYPSSKSQKSEQDDTLSIFEEEYISPGLSQSQFQADDDSSSASTDGDKTDPSLEMKEIFETVENNFSDLSGLDISKKMQCIVDIILETEGYSMDLKDLKDWISKLRKIKNPLSDELKEDFVVVFFKWKEKYSKEESDNQILDFGPSDENLEDSFSDNNGLSGKIDSLIQDAQVSTGNKLSSTLQEISDIVLKSHGAVAANAIRQWISRLRSIRDLLKDEIKEEFLQELEVWKEKFG
ncbi:MAG: hypothetical protein ACXAB8_02740 [Promethearchaeota archaeon]|jgi:hypothetical protein